MYSVSIMPEPGRHQPVAQPLPDFEAEELAQAMAAFTTASRLKLLFALIGIERTVEDLTEATRLSPTVVSQQLRVLRLLRLASSRREGRHVRYRLYDGHVVELLAAIRHHGEHASVEERGAAEARSR